MDRGAWQAMVCKLSKSQTRLKQLSTQGCEQTFLQERHTNGRHAPEKMLNIFSH